MKRKIAVFTGTRAEYGLMYWIIKGLDESKKIDLSLMVGGTHLSNEFGHTIDQIRSDGFPISETLEFILSSETPVGISKSMALGIISAAEFFDRNKPDIVVILGDRFEALAIAQAAMIARIPIAHIHGGESTEGLIDESIRHSITKMAHLHFSSTEIYAKRIAQLGESSDRIFNFGAPGIDNTIKLNLLKRQELSESINFKLEKPYFIVTYHPVTLKSNSLDNLKNLLEALDSFDEFQLVFSYPNADTESRQLIDLLKKYQAFNEERVFLTYSLGQLKYLSLLRHANLVIGNSSSGIIESAAFKVPTVNIGSRQKGRISGQNVIHCDNKVLSIKKAVSNALSSSFKKKCQNTINPYGEGDTSEKIINKLINHPLDGILLKEFQDIR